MHLSIEAIIAIVTLLVMCLPFLVEFLRRMFVRSGNGTNNRGMSSNSLIMSSPFSRRFIFLVNQIYFTHQSSIDNHVHRQAVAQRFRHCEYFAFRTERTIESGLLVYPSTYGTFAFQSAYELLAK